MSYRKGVYKRTRMVQFLGLYSTLKKNQNGGLSVNQMSEPVISLSLNSSFKLGYEGKLTSAFYSFTRLNNIFSKVACKK